MLRDSYIPISKCHETLRKNCISKCQLFSFHQSIVELVLSWQLMTCSFFKWDSDLNLYWSSEKCPVSGAVSSLLVLPWKITDHIRRVQQGHYLELAGACQDLWNCHQSRLKITKKMVCNSVMIIEVSRIKGLQMPVWKCIAFLPRCWKCSNVACWMFVNGNANVTVIAFHSYWDKALNTCSNVIIWNFWSQLGRKIEFSIELGGSSDLDVIISFPSFKDDPWWIPSSPSPATQRLPKSVLLTGLVIFQM